MGEFTRQRILVVFDNDASRTTVSGIIRHAGMEIVEAPANAQALALAGQHADLIVLGVGRSDPSGFELCRQLKASPDIRAIPVLLLSATPVGDAELRQGIEAGADGHLSESVEAPVLVTTIHTLLRQRETLLALRACEERFRCLTELSSDFYWETDQEHRLTRRSEGKHQTARSAFKSGPKIGKQRWEISFVTPGAAGWQAHQAVLDAHQPFTEFEFSRLADDGGVRRFSISGQPMFGIHGEFKGYIGVGRDRTEAMLAQTKLHEGELQFRATFEQAAVGMAHLSTDGAWLRVNQKLCDMVGYTREELLRGNFRDITHPDDRALDAERMLELLHADKSTDSREKRYLHKNGKLVWVNVSVALVNRACGGPDYLLSVIEDISERKHSEYERSQSEERFRGLVEQSLVGIYMSDGADFHYANPRTEEILGYARGELSGSTLDPLVVEEDRPALRQQIRQVAAGDLPVAKLEFRMQRKDGTVAVIGAQITGTNIEDRPAIIGMMQDVTDRVAAQAEAKRHISEIEAAFIGTVELATSLTELRDPFAAGHSKHVGLLAKAIGSELGLTTGEQEGLRVAGYLHDIGMITLPAEILCKPGKLSAIEHEMIRQHPQAGYDVLQKVPFPWAVADVALQHHERMDGSGYPRGLQAEAIGLAARIVAVADVVSAMLEHRPYRPSVGMDGSLAEVERGAGHQYDLRVVQACLSLFRDQGFRLPA